MTIEINECSNPESYRGCGERKNRTAFSGTIQKIII